MFLQEEQVLGLGSPVNCEGEGLLVRGDEGEQGKSRAGGDGWVCGREEDSWMRRVSDQVVFQSRAGRRSSRGDSQLAIDRAHMEIDGHDPDDELLGHLRAGQALCKQAQHFHLAGGQTIGRGCCWLWLWSRCWCWREWLKQRDVSLGGEGVFWRHAAALFPGASHRLLSQVRAHGSQGDLVQGLQK